MFAFRVKRIWEGLEVSRGWRRINILLVAHAHVGDVQSLGFLGSGVLKPYYLLSWTYGETL